MVLLKTGLFILDRSKIQTMRTGCNQHKMLTLKSKTKYMLR